jgi:hypothetical protein
MSYVRIFTVIILMMLQKATLAQYAPQAGISGSTAISATSTDITGWATSCSVQRGFIDIASPGLGNTTTGADADATGAANGSIVCLGDSGVATVTFAAALYNGPGADFAVFENGFKDPANGSMAFLELAFVEVSSDGVNFVRFAANSNTPTNTQIPGSGVYMDAALINNLAGKYIANYGTPFDLEELKDAPGLDVNNITHVRIVDVVGSVSGHASHDQTGKKINDPYPTNFPTGGFDLDAVAAMHMHATGIAANNAVNGTGFYPNPATEHITVHTAQKSSEQKIRIVSVTGTEMMHLTTTGRETEVSITQLPAGFYHVLVCDNNQTVWTGKLVKY